MATTEPTPIQTATSKLSKRSTVTNHRPDEFVNVPNEQQGVAFYHGDRIEETANRLLATLQEFSAVNEFKYVYFWTEKEIRVNGAAEFGRITRPAGLVKHLMGNPEYLVVMSAPACRGLANYEFEAAIYHILSHAYEEEKENGLTGETTFTPAIRHHDFEGFTDEVTRYGFWSIGLRAASEPYAKQLKLALAPTPKQLRAEDDAAFEDAAAQ